MPNRDRRNGFKMRSSREERGGKREGEDETTRVDAATSSRNREEFLSGISIPVDLLSGCWLSLPLPFPSHSHFPSSPFSIDVPPPPFSVFTLPFQRKILHRYLELSYSSSSSCSIREKDPSCSPNRRGKNCVNMIRRIGRICRGQNVDLKRTRLEIIEIEFLFASVN